VKKKNLKQEKSNIFFADFNSSSDILAEAFRMLRLHIDCLFENVKESDPAKTILITSALQSEGKTTIACNLAVACAGSGLKTLLIDGDLKNPSVHRAFKCERKPGISDILLGDITESYPIHNSEYKNLHILTAGKSIAQSTELLASAASTEFLNIIRKKYQLIIIDSPPIGLVSDAGILAGKVDKTYLVVRSGKTNRRTVEKAVETLTKLGVLISGIIMSRCSFKSNKYMYYSEYPAYYSRYYRDES